MSVLEEARSEGTIDWLLGDDNPAAAVLTRRLLLGESPDSAETAAVWARRNEYSPVSAILAAQTERGCWEPALRDYEKYHGALWQVHFLGELWADASDERAQRGAEYAFSRQLPDGSWSANGRPGLSIQCLTANVGRALARMGWARDERIIHALEYVADTHRRYGPLVCAAGGSGFSLNGYCHMLAPKLLLFLAEVPRDVWPDGTVEVRDAAIDALRDKQILRSLPVGTREFATAARGVKRADAAAFRKEWIAEHPPSELAERPGWLRFGYPLSYNSDALEALAALIAVGEEPRAEYADAVGVVRSSADSQWRWKLKNSFNGKMIADVETKGQPSKWLTLRALQVLAWAEQ